MLNSIINKGAKQKSYPQYFRDNVKKNYMEDVVNSFNNFFVNVGPNLAEKSGVFPNKMTIAKIAKTGDRHNFTNYRPLSLLPQFSKFFEKLFNNRLDKFIKNLD